LQFMHWFNNLQSIPTIRQLRDRTSMIANSELNNARKRLAAGENAELVLQQFAHALSQKFMHSPTESLRQSHDEELLRATRELFDLDKIAAEQEMQLQEQRNSASDHPSVNPVGKPQNKT